MKKIIVLMLVFCAIFSLTSISVFAEESAPVTEAVPAPDNGSEVLEAITNVVTDGALWAKIGVILLSALSIIVAVTKNLNSVKIALSTVYDFLKGNGATKEDTANALEKVKTDLKKDYKVSYDDLSQKYNELIEKTNTQTAIVALLSLQLVKSPNARVQLMSIISDAKKIGGSIEEVVTTIEAEIEKADAEEPKPDTPALDKIVSDVNSVDEASNSETAMTTKTIRLG